MDTVQIGKFLAELRHEHNLTQEKLGEKLNVTNKTISRWENGNYMPPVEMLQELSKLYGVSINELLSGKRLTDVEYKNSAENNLTGVLSVSAFETRDKIDFYKKKWKKEHLFMIVIELIAIIALFIVGLVFNDILEIIALLIGILWRMKRYNQMMTYIEKHAFSVQQK